MQKSKHNTAKCVNINNYKATFVHTEGDHLQIELHTCCADRITPLSRVKIDQSLCLCYATPHGKQLGSLRTTMALQARHLGIKHFTNGHIRIQLSHYRSCIQCITYLQICPFKMHVSVYQQSKPSHFVKVYIISDTHVNTTCQT